MARHLLSSSYISQAPRILSSLFSHVRWCHLNMGESLLSQEASENPGMDFKHWFVGMNINKIKGPNGSFTLSNDELFDFYIKTLAKVVGSEEEAKKKIYKVNFIVEDEIYAQGPEPEPGIGCEIDWETSNLLRALPYVTSIFPDLYPDPEKKDYGGQFSYVNGKLYEMSSKRMLEVQLSSRFLEKPWSELLSSRPNFPSPWLLLPPPAFGDKEQYNNAYRFYSIAERKEFSIKRNEEEEEEEDEFVGSSHGWLALFRRSNCQLFLSNPLSCQHIKLPSIQTLGSQVGKVIISCSPNSEEEYCRAVMIFGPENRLAFCWPGHSTEWTLIGCKSCDYSDVVYSPSHKLFLCLTNSGGLESWDLRDPMCPRMVEEHKFDVPMWEVGSVLKPRIHEVKHLVLDEQSEELFIVVRQILRHQSGWGYYVQSSDPIYPYTTDAIKMYKIDKERKGCFCCPKTLNGLAMFIGTSHSFALPASKYPEFDKNCILYTDEKRLIPPNWAALPYGDPDFDVFKYADQFFFAKDCNDSAFKSYKYPYVYDRRTMKRVPPLPMWFTPTLP